MGWELIGGDPAPGSPDAVETAAGAMLRVADLARMTRDGLMRDVARLGTAAWKGTAAAAFRADVAELPERLGEVDESYETAGRALRAFRLQLERSQGEARSARTAAELADADRRAAQQRLDNARMEAGALRSQRRTANAKLLSVQAQQTVTIDPVQRSSLDASVASARARSNRLHAEVKAADQTITRHEGAVREAEARLRQAQADAARIRERMDVYVEAAVTALKQAEKYGNLPGFTERLKADAKQLVDTYGPAVLDTLPQILQVLDVAQAALTVLALLPTPLAPALAVAAVAVGVTGLLVSAAIYSQQPGGLTNASKFELASRALGALVPGARALGTAGKVGKGIETVLTVGQGAAHVTAESLQDNWQGGVAAGGVFLLGKGLPAGGALAIRGAVRGANKVPALRSSLTQMSRNVRQASQQTHGLVVPTRHEAHLVQSLLGRGRIEKNGFLPGNTAAGGPQSIYNHALPADQVNSSLRTATEWIGGVSDVHMEAFEVEDRVENLLRDHSVSDDDQSEIDVDLNPSPYGTNR